MRNRIIDHILCMSSPFSLKQLFDGLKEKGISDKDYILFILDELREMGLVSYIYKNEASWVYINEYALA